MEELINRRQMGTVGYTGYYKTLEKASETIFRQNPDAIQVIIMAKFVSLEEDILDLVHLRGVEHLVPKAVISQLKSFSRSFNKYIEKPMTKYYETSAPQMEQIQSSFGRINDSYEHDLRSDNLLCSIRIKIASIVQDIDQIIELIGSNTKYWPELKLSLQKFSARGFWKKYHRLDPDFDSKLETIQKMY